MDTAKLRKNSKEKITQSKGLIKSYSKSIQFILLVIVTLVAFFLFQDSKYYPQFQEWVIENPYKLYPTLLILKILAIVWPPLPTSVLLIALSPTIGWFNAFLVDYIGEMIGIAIAYWLGYEYGDDLIGKIIDKEALKKLQSIRIKPGKEFETLMILRVFGGTFFELITYFAGLIRVPFKIFMLSSAISYFFIALATYYLAEGILSAESLLINLALLAIIMAFFYKYRRRYFEHLPH